MKKTVYILRGVSGSGKTTLAKELIKGRCGVICTADDYFEKNGLYHFNASQLGHAHAECREKFNDALNDNTVHVIVVANTNTTARDYEPYENLAKEHEANVFFLVIENRHNNKDVHNVPDESRKIQEHRIRNSLKLR